MWYVVDYLEGRDGFVPGRYAGRSYGGGRDGEGKVMDGES